MPVISNATDPQSLLAQAKCYNCYGTPGELMLMKLALLQQIALSLNPMAATDPQSLLDQAKCYNCYGTSGLWALFELALLQQIAVNGSGGGTGTGATFGNYGGGQPNFTPASGTGLAVDTSDGAFWEYYNGAWH
jgi:hypothetical protein